VSRVDGVENRVLVRAPGDVWSVEFREELRKDRRFEGSLLLREIGVLCFVAAVIALRVLAS
jgi:hypothetical protein